MTQATTERPPKPSPPARIKQEPGLRSVWKHNRWLWRGELRLPDNSLKTCEDVDYAAAAEKLRDLRKQYLNILKAPTDTLYEEAIAWLAEQERANRDTETLGDYRYHIDVSIAPGAPGEKLGRKKPIAVTIGDLNRLFVDLAISGGKLGRGLGHNTLSHVKSTLIQVFDQIQTDGKLDQNVAEKSKLPGKEILRQPKTTRAPNRLQIEDIFAEAAQSDRMVEQFLQLGVGIGSRPGEGLGAKWENIDWGEGTLTINSTVKRKKGYTFTDGRRQQEKLVVGAKTKTESSKRTVLLPAFALDALRRRLIDQEEQRQKAGFLWKERGLVFTTDIGGPVGFNYMGKRVKAITEACGLGSWSITEVTRRTFATRVAMARDEHGRALIKEEDLAKAMGHKDGNPRMVRQFYIDHGQLPVSTATAAVMDNIFGRTR